MYIYNIDMFVDDMQRLYIDVYIHTKINKP